MLYKRGKRGIWYYSFEFGGRHIHESSKSTSKTVAREAERTRRRQLEEQWNRIEKKSSRLHSSRPAPNGCESAPR